MTEPAKELSPNAQSDASFVTPGSLCGCPTSCWLIVDFFMMGDNGFGWNKLPGPKGKCVMQPLQGHLLTSWVHIVFTTNGNFQRDICKFDGPVLSLLLKPRQVSAAIIPGITGFWDSGLARSEIHVWAQPHVRWYLGLPCHGNEDERLLKLTVANVPYRTSPIMTFSLEVCFAGFKG